MKVAAGAIAAAGIGAAIKDVVGLAANAEQSLGGVQSVFKDYASSVVTMSNGADKALGLSANSYRELATVIGSQLKNAGVPMDELGGKTNSLVTTGADLAAMFGGTTKDAVGALSSALKGEMDPIEKYGISLNDAALKAEAMSLGVYNGKGSLDASAKSMAVMSLITKQGADAVGAFGRESDTAAGLQARATAQWENLRTTIGQKLIPAFSALMDFVSRVALPGLQRIGNWLGDTLGPIFREIVGGIEAFAAAWKYNDGEITSSGFPGFMERAGYIARQVFGFFRESVIPTLASFARWVKDNSTLVLSLVAVMGALRLIVLAHNAAMVLSAAGGLAGWLRQTKLITTAVKVWTAMQWLLNAALRANPIGIVITVVTALVAAFVAAYKRSESFRNMVNGVWSALKTAGAWLVDTGKKVGEWIIKPFTTAYDWAKRFIDALRNFKLPGWVQTLKDAIGGVAGFLGSAAGKVAGFLGVGDGPGRRPVGGNALRRVQTALPRGLYVTSTYRTPAHNARIGGSPTSYHLDRANPAVDIGGPTWALDAFHRTLRSMGGWRELLWRVPGHYDHIHVAHAGGTVSASWPRMPGDRVDERTARLQVGEVVVPRGIARLQGAASAAPVAASAQGTSVVIQTYDNPKAIVRALAAHEQMRAALAPTW